MSEPIRKYKRIDDEAFATKLRSYRGRKTRKELAKLVELPLRVVRRLCIKFEITTADETDPEAIEFEREVKLKQQKVRRRIAFLLRRGKHKEALQLAKNYGEAQAIGPNKMWPALRHLVQETKAHPASKPLKKGPLIW